ncbi:MAG: Cof-type HAD-IIB family hydrolase [Lachnospiraceae bacterium]|nr:Cof-type HAD-IIB family hydrolase [Lachnospiraceae bacterium]
MRKEIRLIGLDLDGTTFTNDKRITKYTKEIIEKAIKYGITVLPCTGRPYTGLPKEFLEIEGVKYAITSNGAAIVETDTGKSIYTNNIAYDLAADTMEKLLKLDILTAAYINGKYYMEEKIVNRMPEFISTGGQLKYFYRVRNSVQNLPDFIRKNQFNVEKIYMMFNDMDLREQVKKEYEENKKFLTTSSMNNLVELNAPKADKGNALLVLADILHIPHEQTMACGDHYNDEAMLKKAGFSVAMGNAVSEIKEICDFITRTNEEEGVAYAIEKVIEGRFS